MLSPGAQQAIDDYICACKRDLLRYRHFLDTNTYWQGKPLSDKDRLHCEHIVKLRTEAIQHQKRLGNL